MTRRRRTCRDDQLSDNMLISLRGHGACYLLSSTDRTHFGPVEFLTLIVLKCDKRYYHFIHFLGVLVNFGSIFGLIASMYVWNFNSLIIPLPALGT